MEKLGGAFLALLAAAVVLAASGSAAGASIFGWDWSWEPNVANAEAGTSVCFADFNADGYADLAVGAPDYLHLGALEVGAVRQASGEGRLHWDGATGHGHDAGAGVFFVRMRFGETWESVRIVRVR